jgi:DNA invertase Pin-like site-specific DNA recombinase
MSETDIIDGYIRVSRKAGREGESYQTVAQQEAAIMRWIDANGYALGTLVTEEDVSGKLRAEERSLETLLRRAETGQSAGIVVQYQDRLTRGRKNLFAGDPGMAPQTMYGSPMDCEIA